MTIQEQIQANRQIILSLPTYLNETYVWNPEELTHEVQAIEEATDHGPDAAWAWFS